MSRLTFHLIFHTHWDREWYLPRAAFQARLVPAFGELLETLEREPDARFVMDGQAVAIEDALDVEPDWRERTAALVSNGRLEAGPWYILADELIPSGESLVRNLLQGTRDASALGRRMDVLYSPDAFGHPAILPSLAAQFGIGSAVAWRGLGRAGGVGRDFHRWRGPDGSEVLLYHLPSQGYEIGTAIESDWPAIRSALVARAVTSHVAVFVGADHHAPHSHPAAVRDALQGVESGNFVRLSSLTEFFEAAAPEAGAAAAIAGELRWSYGHTWTLQGTFATRARLTRRHSAVELHLQRQVEVLSALAAFAGDRRPQGCLRAAWRTLLQCQFHDTLCGCCSDLVAREQDVRLTSVHAAGIEIARAAVRSLADHDPDRARNHPDQVTPALLLWNPVARARNGVVVAEVSCFRRDVLVGPPSGREPRQSPGAVTIALTASDGRTLPLQVLSVTHGTERLDAARHYPDQDEVDVFRIAFEPPPLSGLGFAHLDVHPVASPSAIGAAPAHSRRIDNRFVTLHIGVGGRIDLIDRQRGERYPGILELFDEQDRGDSYTPWIVNDTVAPGMTSSGEPRSIANGPLVWAIEQDYTVAAGGSAKFPVRVVLMLYANSPVVRIRVQVDNRATDHRLRIRVPVGAGDAATAGAAFGFEQREPVQFSDAEFPVEHPARTAPAHRFVAAGGGDRGIALFSPGLFEYEWTRHRELLVTLIRATGELSRPDLPTRPGHAGWPMATPDAQEPGHHVIDLAIAPVGEDELRSVASLEHLWEETFLPPQSLFIRDFTGDTDRLATIGADLHGAGLVFTACKPAERGAGMVLRCYNVESAPVAGRWTFKRVIARAVLVRADETEIVDLPIDDSRAFVFGAAPRAMVSVLVVP